jgi:hypothetical protein
MAQLLRVRLPRDIYVQMRADLMRPHTHAGERVGFLSTSLKTYADRTSLLLVTGYQHVEDAHYIPDQNVGARISSTAIRTTMQRVLDTHLGAFHVHIHGHKGTPWLSRTDNRELPRLVNSLRVADPNQAHGIFLMSEDMCNCWVWLPGAKEPTTPELVTIVGFPLEIINPKGWPVGDAKERFSRQSFLGPQSQALLETVRIGIVGLGGGGSHIVQQLAHIGVQHFNCFDGDVVDDSNLNRLVGALASDPSCQTPKIEVAQRVITGLTPEADIVVHRGHWQEHAELLEQCDLVFGSVDTFAGRRNLEATCRRYLIPYIDIGMDVHIVGDEPPRMAGQVLLSLPGQPCMHCLGFLNEKRLAQEAARYGEAGGRPQVVWPNGVLASTATGLAIELLTSWTGRKDQTVYLSYDGNTGSVTPHPRLAYMDNQVCSHFPLNEVGPPVWR